MHKTTVHQHITIKSTCQSNKPSRFPSIWEWFWKDWHLLISSFLQNKQHSNPKNSNWRQAAPHQVSSPGPPHSDRQVCFLNWFDLSLWANVRVYSKFSSTKCVCMVPSISTRCHLKKHPKVSMPWRFLEWVLKVQQMYQNKDLRYFCNICVWQKLSSQIHRLFSSKLVNIITEFSVELSRHKAVCCAIFPQTSCFNILKTRLPSPHEKSLQWLYI